jgi:hypothetical protein
VRAATRESLPGPPVSHRVVGSVDGLFLKEPEVPVPCQLVFQSIFAGVGKGV